MCCRRVQDSHQRRMGRRQPCRKRVGDFMATFTAGSSAVDFNAIDITQLGVGTVTTATPTHLILVDPADPNPQNPSTYTEFFGTGFTYSVDGLVGGTLNRSEEHTSELQSLRHLVCR